MDIIKSAVILTVYNRRDVTLRGIRSLFEAITILGPGYSFDFFMTDDGSSDGTSDAVTQEFPQVHIIKGDGTLYWSGGMRKAWQEALEASIKYDYYLWFNDDAILYSDALSTLYDSYKEAPRDSIITGAFCGEDGNVSYGGRNSKQELVSPNGTLRSIYLMNGNLVIIPSSVVDDIGIIDASFKHSFGDWDYGCRAIKSNHQVLLSKAFVGVTNRHDNDLEPYLNPKLCIKSRFKELYSDKHSVLKSFLFCRRHIGLIKAVRVLTLQHLYAFAPSLYKYKLCVKSQ